MVEGKYRVSSDKLLRDYTGIHGGHESSYNYQEHATHVLGNQSVDRNDSRGSDH